MSRPIKFRVWDTKYNDMLLDPIVFADKGGSRLAHILGDTQWIYQQFTGLLDKNGVEIYEGDLLQGGSEIWEVAFGSGEFHLTCRSNHGIGAEIAKMATFKRVIGNIYENPELLERVKPVETLPSQNGSKLASGNDVKTND